MCIHHSSLGNQVHAHFHCFLCSHMLVWPFSVWSQLKLYGLLVSNYPCRFSWHSWLTCLWRCKYELVQCAHTHTDYYIGLNNTMEGYMYTPINIFIFHYQHKGIVDMWLLQHPVYIAMYVCIRMLWSVKPACKNIRITKILLLKM